MGEKNTPKQQIMEGLMSCHEQMNGLLQEPCPRAWYPQSAVMKDKTVLQKEKKNAESQINI